MPVQQSLQFPPAVFFNWPNRIFFKVYKYKYTGPQVIGENTRESGDFAFQWRLNCMD